MGLALSLPYLPFLNYILPRIPLALHKAILYASKRSGRAVFYCGMIPLVQKIKDILTTIYF